MSALTRFEFTLSVQLETPALQSGLPMPWSGFDAAPLTDQNGALIISGDQIEGYVRAVMIANGARDDEVDRWFGREGRQTDAIEGEASGIGVPGRKEHPLGGERATLKIFDLVGPEAPKEYHRYHRIQIDDDTGSAAPGAWQVVAQPALPGAPASFVGRGRLFCSEQAEAERLMAWIAATMKITPALGAIKSAGFGRLLAGGEVGLGAPTPLRPAVVDTAALSGCDVELRFDQPFLIDPEMRGGNVYDGSEVIPGSVIKGAIADLLRMGDAIGDYDALLSVLVVRHAFPSARGGERPLVPPLSLAFDGETLVDNALVANEDQPLRFAPDWKATDYEEVGRRYYVDGSVPRHVRTRAAIQGNNVPIDGKLFSQRLIATNAHVWKSAFALPDDAHEEQRRQLGALMALLRRVGLPRIGKTAVPAQLDWFEQCAEELPMRPATDGVQIVLQTPAWMIPAEWLLGEDGNPAIVELEDLYERYFSEVAGCQLIDFMALERWSGGSRFVGRLSQFADRYYPWLLTRAGSVFVLNGVSETMLDQWRRCGLPLPGACDWETCPFVPENGFGEIRIDDAANADVS